MAPGKRLGAAAVIAVLIIGCGPGAREERVVVAYPAGPSSLMPDAASEEFTSSVLSNVYEPLVELDRGLSVRSGLAESWYNQDELTWVFKLRRGVRLHDGRALRAQDVALSLEHARGDAESERQAELTAVRGIDAPDERTIVIHTRFPFAALPNRLASVPIWVEPSRGGAPLQGTGPYRVRSWTPRGDTVLEALGGHRAGTPAVRVLEFRVVQSLEERLALLRRGEVHLVVDVPPHEVPSLRASGLQVLSERGLRVLYLGMDCAREANPDVAGTRNPLRDLHVRQAIGHAIDRQALVKGPLGGQAEVVEQVVAPGVFGYHEALPSRSFDRGEARRLLAAAGWGDGFAVTLDFMPGKYRAVEAVVRSIGADLAAVRIHVTPRPSEAADFFARIGRNETAFYLMGWIATSGDAGVSYDYLFHSPGRGFGTHNGGGYSSSEVDRLLEEASGRLQPEERRRLLTRAGEKLHADAPVIPLYRQTDLYAAVAGLEFRPRVDRRIHGGELRWRRRSS